MAQWPRVLIALLEDSGLVLSTHVTAQSRITPVLGQSHALFFSSKAQMHIMHIQTCRQTFIHITQNKEKKRKSFSKHVCMRGWVFHAAWHACRGQRSADSFQKSILSFCHVSSRDQKRLSASVASTFTS